MSKDIVNSQPKNKLYSLAGRMKPLQPNVLIDLQTFCCQFAKLYHAVRNIAIETEVHTTEPADSYQLQTTITVPVEKGEFTVLKSNLINNLLEADTFRIPATSSRPNQLSGLV